MDTYQNTAEELLRGLAQLKSQERALLADIKAIQALLTHHVENGDLDHLKTESENTYHFEDTNYIFNAVGSATQKQGNPFWTVRA